MPTKVLGVATQLVNYLSDEKRLVHIHSPKEKGDGTTGLTYNTTFALEGLIFVIKKTGTFIAYIKYGGVNTIYLSQGTAFGNVTQRTAVKPAFEFDDHFSIEGNAGVLAALFRHGQSVIGG